LEGIRIFENKVARRLSATKKHKAIGRCRKLQNE
jgi:hypothetical protein